MDHGTETWLLPDSIPAQPLLATVAEVFTLREEPCSSTTAIYSDTFDWRLYQQGYVLRYHDPGWTLCHWGRGEEVAGSEGPEPVKPCSVRDFPAGRLRDILEPLLSVRSLLPLTTVSVSGRVVHLLNSDDKTVARLVFEEQQAGGKKKVFRTVRLLRLRGYDEEADTVRRLLDACGVNRPVSPQIGFEQGLRAGGRFPLDYTSKFTLELDHQHTARQAMTAVYQQLLTAMRRNIPGVIDDLDSEFLHDLRVAIRRTRSGLSLVGKVFPAETTAAFKADFGYLGSITGPTRDLDVYLLGRDDYIARLPPVLRGGLEAFFRALAANRIGERKKLVAALRSRRTKKILTTWETYLRSEDRKPAELAELPVATLAGRIIHRRYKRVLKDGAVLTATTPDEDIHRLRIQGKKLRYAIEFFSSLYPAEEMQTVIRQLKKLQDVLGSFNDLSVQQQVLSRHIGSLRPGSRRSLDLAAALGALMHSLYEEQQLLRSHLEADFALFSSPENRELFTRLFKPAKEKE